MVRCACLLFGYTGLASQLPYQRQRPWSLTDGDWTGNSTRGGGEKRSDVWAAMEDRLEGGWRFEGCALFGQLRLGHADEVLPMLLLYGNGLRSSGTNCW